MDTQGSAIAPDCPEGKIEQKGASETFANIGAGKGDSLVKVTHSDLPHGSYIGMDCGYISEKHNIFITRHKISCQIKSERKSQVNQNRFDVHGQRIYKERRVNRVYTGITHIQGGKRMAVPTISRISRVKLVDKIVDMTGMSRREAENALNATGIAINAWLEGMIRDIPPGTQGVCLLKGFGAWTVKYARRGRRSSWRDKHGLPQRPEMMQLSWKPNLAIRETVRRVNTPIKEAYLKEYRPARERYTKIRKPEDGTPPWERMPQLRQSVISELKDTMQPGQMIPIAKTEEPAPEPEHTISSQMRHLPEEAMSIERALRPERPKEPIKANPIQTYDTPQTIQERINQIKANKGLNPPISRYEPEFP